MPLPSAALDVSAFVSAVLILHWKAERGWEMQSILCHLHRSADVCQGRSRVGGWDKTCTVVVECGNAGKPVVEAGDDRKHKDTLIDCCQIPSMS